MNEHDAIQLPDGRKLGFVEYGDPDGRPIFYFPGFPCSRLEGVRFHAIGLSQGYRIIGIDRPGIGLSTFQKKRRILSWPADVVSLADHLGFDSFSIMGHSAGSAYVAACAYAIPERLKGITIISGLAPLNEQRARYSLSWEKRIVYALTTLLPFSSKLLMYIALARLKNANSQDTGLLSEVDQQVFSNLEYQKSFKQVIMEAFRNGITGPAHELELMCKPWDFSLKEIKKPIIIWQGDQDLTVPIDHARILAEVMQNSKLIILKNEGHLSILDKITLC